MSSGGATTNASCNGSPSPRPHGPATHRRRVADFMDAEKGVDCYVLNGVDDDDLDSDNGSGVHHHRHPVIGYLSLLRKKGPSVPERILRMEDSVLRAFAIAQCLVSGKNVGRTIFGALMIMVVVSVFLKVSFMMGGNVEARNGKRRENGLLILQTNKDDWAMAQMIVSDIEASSGAVMPKRLLEKFSCPGDENSSFCYILPSQLPNRGF